MYVWMLRQSCSGYPPDSFTVCPIFKPQSFLFPPITLVRPQDLPAWHTQVNSSYPEVIFLKLKSDIILLFKAVFWTPPLKKLRQEDCISVGLGNLRRK